MERDHLHEERRRLDVDMQTIAKHVKECREEKAAAERLRATTEKAKEDLEAMHVRQWSLHD